MTRGSWGFVLANEAFGTPIYSDAYPDGFGVFFLDWLKRHSQEELQPRVAALKRYEGGELELTGEQANAVGQALDIEIAPGTVWFDIEDELEGLEMDGYLDAGFIVVDSTWSFAEWVYLVDLDTGALEVHHEIMRNPHAKELRGRLSAHSCDLLAAWPLERLPTDDEFGSRLRDEYESRWGDIFD